MTDLQVLLENIRVVAMGCAGTLLLLWGIFYFFRNLFGEAGRNPVKIAVSALAITGAAGVFAMIPSLISAGSNTGEQIGGGGGYSMPAPAPLLPAATDLAGDLAAA
ncbi:hypothetical protein [Mycolicibacterium frederiksbergense]|uniref:hypothetical protein n=1 Tax=Mycolicibacterium frederiksbergense TaxID=117567 RepID=UPI00399A783C